MSKKIDTSHIVKLDDTNYQRWKLQISLVLRAREVWDITNGKTTRTDPVADATGAEDWDKLDMEAQAIMVPTLSATQTIHVYGCDTAKSMWDKLADVNCDSSTLNK